MSTAIAIFKSLLTTRKFLSFILLVWTVSGIFWILKVATFLPLDIDESGYIGFAVRNCKTLTSGGIASFFSVVSGRDTFAPFQPLLGTIFGCTRSPNLELFIPLLASVFFIWEYMRTQKFRALGLILVFTCPMFLQMSTSAQFGMLSSVTFAVSALYIVESGFFLDLKYSIYAGVALSVALLSRTMFIAFAVIEIVCVGVVLGLFFSKRARQRVMGFLSFALIQLIFAAPWYVVHANSVFGYLSNYGYGLHSGSYGSRSGIFKVDVWKFQYQVFDQNYLTLCGYFIFGLITLVSMYRLYEHVSRNRNTISGQQKNRGKKSTGETANSLVICFFYIILISGLFAIMCSTRNITSSGLLPMFLVAVLLLAKFLEILDLGIKIEAFALFLSFVLLLTVTFLRFQSDSRLYLGNRPVIKATSARAEYYQNSLYGTDDSSKMTSTKARAWLKEIKGVAEDIGKFKCVGFGFRHSIINVNAISLELLYKSKSLENLGQIDPVTAISQADYSEWVGKYSEGCLLLTLNSSQGQFRPAPDLSFLTTALEENNYHVSRVRNLPDGSEISEWHKI